VAEPSGARDSARVASGRAGFSRGRFVIGLVLVTLIAAGAAFGLGKLRTPPSAGRMIYAAGGRVIERDLGTGAERTLDRVPKDTFQAIPSRDGHWVVYSNLQGEMWMLDLNRHRRWQLSDGNGYPQSWSPDNRIVVRDKGRFVVVDPEGGNRKFPVASRVPPVWIDRKTFVIGGPNALDEIQWVDTIGLHVTSKGYGALPITVSPDGKELLATRREDVIVAKLRGTTLVSHRTVFKGQAYTGATSPDGLVSFAGLDPDKAFGVWVLRGGTQKPLRITRAKVDALTWTRTGSILIYEIKGVLYSRAVPNGKAKRLTVKGREVYLGSFAVVG
jgi:hypothetical protein